MIRPDLYADGCCIKVRFFVEIIVDLRFRSFGSQANKPWDGSSDAKRQSRPSSTAITPRARRARLDRDQPGGGSMRRFLFSINLVSQDRPAVRRKCNLRLQRPRLIAGGVSRHDGA